MQTSCMAQTDVTLRVEGQCGTGARGVRCDWVKVCAEDAVALEYVFNVGLSVVCSGEENREHVGDMYR